MLRNDSLSIRRWQGVGVLLLVAASITLAQAPPPQGEPAPDESADNRPGRGVARISVVAGDVSVRRGDSGDWLAAAPNAPLVVQDRVQTGVNSRAEVQMDYSNIARLAPNSEIRFAELEYQRFVIQVASGTVTYRVLRDLNAEAEVSTPSVALRPIRKGVYRITVQPDGTTEIVVRSGEAEIATQKGTERLTAGRTMLVRGTPNDPEFQLTGAPPRDEWDQWNEGRDRELERSGSYKYVSSSIYGAEDLDQNGQWVNDPPYGNVWAPNAGPDWAPYRNGRWSWIDWYGWSWVSYDPWGWAPYHYGRWYHGPRGWCWWPGAIGARHYWSPGLVAWVGFGGGGVGLGFGHVGWIPLAPYEPFHPWYGWGYYRGAGGRYGGNHVTVVNNVNVTNIYRNARVNNGITAVRSSDFTAGRAVNNVRFSANELHQANLMRGQLPIAPERASQRMADRLLAATPRSNDQASFYSRRTTRPGGSSGGSTPVPFEQQQRSMQDLSRRTFGGSAASSGPAAEASRQGGMRSGSTPGAGSVGSSGSSTDRGGWRRFGDPSNAGASAGRSQSGNPGSSQSSDRGGWRRFGDPGPQDNMTRSGARRMGEQGGSAAPSQSRPNSFPQRVDPPRQSAPAQQTTPGRRGNQNFGGAANGEPLRLSPSIVRERPQRSYQPYTAPSGSSGRGSASPAPARTNSYSAPSYQGGGGRSSGGGGASSGGHSSGGGGRSGGGSHGGKGR